MSSQYETFGKYVLLEKLATGGMAEVYLSKAPSAGGISKFFAIKRILPQFSESPEFIDMFKDEAKIAINLNHSNVVSIYEFGVEKKQFFLVMDYVEGRNLRQILNKMKKSSSQLTTEQILYIVKEVAAGLDNAHRCLDGSTGRPLNITHRDMSPQNVMISFEGEVKIVDFGIAKAESQLETTRAGTLKGKFGYMSPEQAEGLTVDLRTDIFSLGIVLWELLASDRLFVANNEINTLRKIRDCQIPSLRKINPSVPQELDRIVNKALARDRNLRYQTAAAFEKDLNKFLNRQYPDFSPQDFSVFIKNLYSSEILENRNRLIEYAKVPFPNQKSDDISEFTTTQTETGSFSSSKGKRGKGQPEAPKNFIEKNKAQVSFDNLQVNRREVIRKSIELKESNEQPLVTENQKPSNLPKVPPPRESSPSVSDDSSSFVQNTGKTAIEPMRPPIGTGHSGFNPAHRHRPPEKQSSPLKRVLVLGVVAFTAIYLFYPSLLDKVSPFTEKLQKTDLSSKDGDPNAGVQLPRGKVDVLITANVSGADIYIDGERTGKVTPSLVKVTLGQAFSLDLQMPGYQNSSSRWEAKRSGQKITAQMKKEVTGYLNISVSPASKNNVIYVNGEKLDKDTSLDRFKVQAGQRITIRAVNPFTKAEAGQLVVVDREQVKRVQLKLRNKQRKPSNRTR